EVGPVLAHDWAARTERRQEGPYLLEILLDRDPPLVGQPLGVAVRVWLDGAPLHGATVAVAGRPGPGTEATALPVLALVPEATEVGSWAGELVLPVRGAWELEVRVDGPAGIAQSGVGLVAASSTAIPIWLGWLIGLSPLVGVVWFAAQQRRYLRRLQAE